MSSWYRAEGQTVSAWLAVAVCAQGYTLHVCIESRYENANLKLSEN